MIHRWPGTRNRSSSVSGRSTRTARHDPDFDMGTGRRQRSLAVPTAHGPDRWPGHEAHENAAPALGAAHRSNHGDIHGPGRSHSPPSSPPTATTPNKPLRRRPPPFPGRPSAGLPLPFLADLLAATSSFRRPGPNYPPGSLAQKEPSGRLPARFTRAPGRPGSTPSSRAICASLYISAPPQSSRPGRRLGRRKAAQTHRGLPPDSTDEQARLTYLIENK